MTMTDPIADLLTRIRNGIRVHRKFVDCPSSRIKSGLALVLKDEGFVSDVEALQDGRGFPSLRVHLKYDQDGVPAITEIKRTSKPGRRIYTKAKAVPQVRRGLGTAILSTSQGLMTGRKAEELGVGGEVLCTIF